jgi:hypothetical protein
LQIFDEWISIVVTNNKSILVIPLERNATDNWYALKSLKGCLNL